MVPVVDAAALHHQEEAPRTARENLDGLRGHLRERRLTTGVAFAVDVRAKGVFEGYTGRDIPGANISYQCFDQSCYLGQTTADEGIYKFELIINFKGLVNN